MTEAQYMKYGNAIMKPFIQLIYTNKTDVLGEGNAED